MTWFGLHSWRLLWIKEKILVNTKISFLLFPTDFQKLPPIFSKALLLNPFPSKPRFLCVCSTSLLKTLWEKEKLLVTSNFSFSHSAFYLIGELSAIFIKFQIMLLQFGRVWNLSFRKGLRVITLNLYHIILTLSNPKKVSFTHYHTILHFDALKMYSSGKHCVKGEIACNKQFLLCSQCFLPFMTLNFHFKCTLKCCLQFVSIWTSLKIQSQLRGTLMSPSFAVSDCTYFTEYNCITCLFTSTDIILETLVLNLV